ncbi:hypothetical protein BST11_18660 [Mycobacterium alsense]|uniref:CD225/dispanin family protein n=1 Tax=Mycobacterium alsense TaxID=324058 RepID=A0AA41XMN1_9MYCO|nr:CD225/dispanin family protein [Mycobacterium alsense]MCV7378269.1 CD225/dispanin family protein [Mycobacterium alsense]OQZ89266.1 hypothetical protein BST11_18660 [Mycobacterium alsense]
MSYPPGPYEGSPDWRQPMPPAWQQPWPGYPPPQPGWPVPQPGWPARGEPDNHLVWAILVTVLCCLPFGIVSIVYSTKVSGLWAQGRYGEAQEAADNAKKWAIIGAVAGAATCVIAIIWFAIVTAVMLTIPSTPTTTYPGY